MADVMIISFIWLVTSLLFVTIGASTTAAYFVIMRRISDREGTILRDYFSAFQSNFKNATLIFLILAVMILILIFNINYSSSMFGPMQIILFGIYLLMLAELVFLYINVFPLMARFDMGFKQLIKSAFLIANKHLFTTITHVAVFIAIIWFFSFMPILYFFAFGAYCWISSYLLIKVYRKYRPDMDKDLTEEELEAIETDRIKNEYKERNNKTK
jgi:uncharacterized membrane protein YesL